MSIVNRQFNHELGSRQFASMRRACEILLLALLVGSPFEYFFRTRTQSLYSSLKLQLILFLIAWILLKFMEGAARVEGKGFSGLFPNRFVSALLLLVGGQALAAALAPEFQTNAGLSAAKVGLGVLLSIAVADLVRGSVGRSRLTGNLSVWLLVTLAVTGTLVSIIGLENIAGFGLFGHLIDTFQSERYWVGAHLRFSSTMEYPNTAANFISASLFASLALAAIPDARKIGAGFNYIGPLAAVVQGLAVLFTYSRGAIASAVLALALTAWVLWRYTAGRGWRVAAWASVALFFGGIGLQLNRPATPYQNVRPELRRTARYGLAAAAEIKYLEPGREYRETLTVRNDSSASWSGDRFGIAYRWYKLESKEGTPLHPTVTFREDITAGMEKELEVSYKTPLQEGEYFLIWFIFRSEPILQEVERSFSPAVLCVIHPSIPAPPPLSESAVRYLKMVRGERQGLVGTSVPTRSELWRAALRMFRSSPLFGRGPDNFRLAKGRFMDIPKGDEKILANSLYLEFLAGSGLFGLASLLWLLWEFGRIQYRKLRSAGSSNEWVVVWFGVVYFLSFVVHGVVDYFLKFTPTYLLFWTMLGFLCAGVREANDADADRL